MHSWPLLVVALLAHSAVAVPSAPLALRVSSNSDYSVPTCTTMLTHGRWYYTIRIIDSSASAGAWHGSTFKDLEASFAACSIKDAETEDEGKVQFRYGRSQEAGSGSTSNRWLVSGSVPGSRSLMRGHGVYASKVLVVVDGKRCIEQAVNNAKWGVGKTPPAGGAMVCHEHGSS
ncbi:hypothetical protein BJ878DRAFT_506631 [Calycina marina]|uniref:Uncharacterized protein n=1 Tax=Calycina marina TaxID=1763456 RepID=A0A9P8CER0_9HELO|nr:hypothetical protein BJ878DRAFT_506631 [Calycina marina]